MGVFYSVDLGKASRKYDVLIQAVVSTYEFDLTKFRNPIQNLMGRLGEIWKRRINVLSLLSNS